MERMPRIAPLMRSLRVSARVSIPSMPMILFCFEVLVQAHVRPVVGIERRQLLDDKPRHVRLAALDVLPVDAVVADQRVGHRDDLPLVGRIGQDLLVAGHRRVEDDFAFGVPAWPNAVPVKTVPSSRASLAMRACHGAGIIGHVLPDADHIEGGQFQPGRREGRYS